MNSLSAASTVLPVMAFRSVLLPALVCPTIEKAGIP